VLSLLEIADLFNALEEELLKSGPKVLLMCPMTIISDHHVEMALLKMVRLVTLVHTTVTPDQMLAEPTAKHQNAETMWSTVVRNATEAISALPCALLSVSLPDATQMVAGIFSLKEPGIIVDQTFAILVSLNRQSVSLPNALQTLVH
jgi:hypothetical protein